MLGLATTPVVWTMMPRPKNRMHSRPGGHLTLYNRVVYCFEGLYRDHGREHGNYYSIIGLQRQAANWVESEMLARPPGGTERWISLTQVLSILP